MLRIVYLSVLLAVATSVNSARASSPNPDTYSGMVLVNTLAKGGEGSQCGSGTYVNYEGRYYVITNHHVIDGAGFKRYVDFYDGQVRNYRVLVSDPASDLAVLELEHLPRGLRAVRIAQQAPRQGETCWVLGFGYDGYQEKKGTVLGFEQIPSSILLKAYAASGTSGGPVLNQQGHLVAVRYGCGSHPNGRVDNSVTRATELRYIKAILERAKRLPSAWEEPNRLATRR